MTERSLEERVADLEQGLVLLVGAIEDAMGVTAETTVAALNGFGAMLTTTQDALVLLARLSGIETSDLEGYQSAQWQELNTRLAAVAMLSEITAALKERALSPKSS